MTEIIGGPLDGSLQDWANDNICYIIGNGRFAVYNKHPWDENVFQYDGKYHFCRIVGREDIRLDNEEI